MNRQLDEEAIFHVAREIPTADARRQYLDQICAGDQALRGRVEALVAVHAKEENFLQSGCDEPPSTLERSSLTEGPGTIIGRYKLLQKLGEGGFGVVYMAEQSRPVHRKVALKIIKPGMDTHAVVARFEAERQALALMEHENIARVLDGGVTEAGRPYFVMELVRGVPITEYCDKNLLSMRERLRLFVTVCRAVQHAHQKGIIHRDLKPSNILVTLADGQPIVKVIDFGVSKALNQQLTEKTLFTAFGQMIGTPQYMSPEQAEMSCLDVDTRSDVYSLGVLLYELLTGTTPLEAEKLRAAGYAEIQRIIAEEHPPRPSVRLSTMGDDLTVVADHRSTDPKRLRQVIQGELDWIVMKSLEKERGRRYTSPSGLAEDVERFLAGQVVEAHPPSKAYRVRKFVQKNKKAVTVGLALITVLLIGFAGVAAALRSEHMARVELEEQAYRDNMNLAYQAWNEGNRVQLKRCLDKVLSMRSALPAPGFELRYLWARQEEIIDAAEEIHLPMSTPTTITNLAYSGDGNYLAVSCADKSVFLIDKNKAGPPVNLSDEIWGADVVISSRGRYLAAFSTPGHASAIDVTDTHPAIVFEISTGERLEGFQGECDIASAVFSPDEKSLISARADGVLEIRSLPDGNIEWEKKTTVDSTTRIAVSPDGRYLAHATRDKDVFLWDLSNRTLLRQSAPASPYWAALAFSPDSRSLWIAGAFKATQWHVTEEGLHEGSTITQNEITSFSFSSDGKVLALGSADYRIRLWDLENSEWLPPLLQEDYVECVAFSPGGDYLAAGGRDKVVRFWDMRALATSLRCRSLKHHHPPLAVSRDGVVATCHQDGDHEFILKLWKPNTVDRQIAVLDEMTEAVAFSPDGKLLATGSESGVVRIWDLASGQSKTMPKRDASQVNCLAFSLDDKYLISGRKSGRLWKWNLLDDSCQVIHEHRGEVLSMAVSTDGLLATTGGEWHDYGETVVWDLDQDAQLLRKTHPRIGRCVAFSPDGKEIAATDDFSKGEIKVYSLRTGQVVSSLVGHSSKTMALLFSDDGRRLITGSDDGTIRFWDRESGEPLGTLRVDERVRKMALLPDDCTLITASWDGWTRIRKAVAPDEIPFRGSVR